MAFTLPQFNILASYWIVVPVPPAIPAATHQGPAQLYLASKGILDITPGNPNQWVPPVWLRITEAEWIACNCAVGSMVGIPTNTGMYFYLIRWWEYTHLGFPNEYLSLLLEQCSFYGVVPDPAR